MIGQRKKQRMNHMEYLPYMEQTSPDIMNIVRAQMKAYDYKQYKEEDVWHALSKDSISAEDFGILLSPAAFPALEQMAQKAQAKTRQFFGNSISIFTPLYLSNYCENQCVYCGFNCKNKIKRGKLTIKEIEGEMKAIEKTGLREILLLTGESRVHGNIDYIGEAIKVAKKYFTTIGIEIYPLNSDEYTYLHQCGADFVSVYQETYNSDKYEALHIMGPKRIYPYRFQAQERALKGGMRGVGFGALLGLDDFRKDAFATGLHAALVQKKYPHAEISFSCPRLRPYINNKEASSNEVGELQLLQVLLAYRLFLPFAGITVSTRERAYFRDHVVGVVATKVSAGVQVGVGGHEEEKKGDEQFNISDTRTVEQVCTMLKGKGLQPVFSDYIYV